MRKKREGIEEHDMTTHVAEIQVLTHASHLSTFSVTVSMHRIIT